MACVGLQRASGDQPWIQEDALSIRCNGKEAETGVEVGMGVGDNFERAG